MHLQRAKWSIAMDLDTSWSPLFDRHLQQPYFEQLRAFLRQEQQVDAIYPTLSRVFRAFELTPANSVRVVILGQDPYHQHGQPQGLCFSVPDDVPFPPSLRNIFSELSRDLHLPMPQHGCLEAWARRGVLLLNRTLTVRRNVPLSHAKRGWETFTGAVLEFLWQLPQPLGFLLWGAAAKTSVEPLQELASPSPRLLLRAPHPSPLSAHRGFLGCGHFSQVNAFLKSQGQAEIDWQLRDETRKSKMGGEIPE